MHARLALIALGAPILLAGSVIAQGRGDSAQRLEQARSEWRAARADVDRLQQEAANARDKASRIAVERQAAAAGIIAAEAEISALQAELVTRQQAIAAAEARLASKQAPVASLVAGLVNMGRRPPLLSLADSETLAEVVRVRMLLDSTLPVIRARTAGLSAELSQRRRIVASIRASSAKLSDARAALADRQEKFAALEAEADATAQTLGGRSVEAVDRMVMARDSAGLIENDARAQRDASRRAIDLSALGALPPRPMASERGTVDKAFSYRMPATASLVDGVGSVNRDGVRSRGIRLATTRGSEIVAPAAGTIAFAGPFRRSDGVVILDHGNGWMTMLVGVQTDLAKGSKVGQGEKLGRALGEIGVELTRDGHPVSAPMISVRSLSIQAQAR